MADPRYCYFVLETQRAPNGEFRALIAKENEPGFSVTDWTWGKDFKVAEGIAAKRNKTIGLSEDDCWHIQTSTMRGTRAGTKALVAATAKPPSQTTRIANGVKYYKPFYPEYTVESLTNAIKAILVTQGEFDAVIVNHYMAPRSAGGLGYGKEPHRMGTEMCSAGLPPFRCPNKAMKGAYLCRKHRLQAGWVPNKPRLSR
jgi:hypothetical protein